MALDEPKENDTVIQQDGVTFIVDNNLANYIPVFNVGFRRSWLGSGFYIEAGRIGQGCSDSCC